MSARWIAIIVLIILLLLRRRPRDAAADTSGTDEQSTTQGRQVPMRATSFPDRQSSNVAIWRAARECGASPMQAVFVAAHTSIAGKPWRGRAYCYNAWGILATGWHGDYFVSGGVRYRAYHSWREGACDYISLIQRRYDGAWDLAGQGKVCAYVDVLYDRHYYGRGHSREWYKRAMYLAVRNVVADLRAAGIDPGEPDYTGCPTHPVTDGDEGDGTPPPTEAGGADFGEYMWAG